MNISYLENELNILDSILDYYCIPSELPSELSFSIERPSTRHNLLCALVH